ncbi:hypothetical protein QQG55_33315 [Brugia pahangi]|uniref:Flocculation protein FLO11-like n=1 Tax=Brugia pahangi TaxID=6280 RepID=A0A0N4TXS4_BRUPA|nr:unnamed protein product [Brugia pahangi]
MKSKTTIGVYAIGVCVTVAACSVLLYYFLKKKERSHKDMNLDKEIKTAGRPLRKKRGRFQTPRRITLSKHALHTKKVTNSAKMTHTTSNETFGNSSTKLDISSTSRKIKDHSPSSYVQPLEVGISSTSSPEKSKDQYSSESYPPAIIRKHKELPKILLPSEKSEELRDDKTKSVESVSATKLHIAEETPSPTEVIPIDSYCYCGQDVAIYSDAAGELNENCKVKLLPTIVKPVSFDPYSPEDLTQVEGASEEMSKNSTQMYLKPMNHHIIIPFLPILHAITYASKHGQLLEELLQNYDYFESQFT